MLRDVAFVMFNFLNLKMAWYKTMVVGFKKISVRKEKSKMKKIFPNSPNCQNVKIGKGGGGT
jgi:hypothetical protein